MSLSYDYILLLNSQQVLKALKLVFGSFTEQKRRANRLSG